MLQLRIFRRWTWEIDCPASEIRFGGSNPMKLVAHDELQFYGQGADGEIGWNPVLVVEDEKPQRPMSHRERMLAESFKREEARVREIFGNAKQAHFAVGIPRHGEPSKCICGGMILDKKCENDTDDRAI